MRRRAQARYPPACGDQPASTARRASGSAARGAGNRIRATMVPSRGKQTTVVPATDSVHGSWKHRWCFPGEEISDQRRRVIDRSVEQRDPFTRSP